MEFKNKSRRHSNEKDRGVKHGYQQGKQSKTNTYVANQKILSSFFVRTPISSVDGAKFLNAMINLNYVDSLVEVTKDCTRILAFKSALGSLQGPHVKLVFRLLDYFVPTKGAFALCAQQCCSEIYNAGIIGRSISASTVPDEGDRSPVSFLLSSLLLKNEVARKDPIILGLASLLKDYPEGVALRSLLCHNDMKAHVTSDRMVSLHNNDDPCDFRNISILPTIDELLCAHTRVSKFGLSCNITENISQVGKLLDRQFRLLREDMVQPLREELKKELDRKDGSMKCDSPGLHGEAALVGYDGNRYGRVYCVVDVQLNAFVMSGLQQKSNSPDLPTYFKKGRGARVFRKGSLVVFLSTATKEFFAVGTVMRRYIDTPLEYLSNDKDANDKLSTQECNRVRSGFLRVGISIPATVLSKLLIENPSSGTRILLAPNIYCAKTSYFAYKDVLGRLQDMSSINFEEEICHGGNASLPLDIPIQPPNSVTRLLTSDASQYEALQSICNNRFTLIQGPPGTGKSYIGVQAVKAILASDPSARVLCLCYTNHALDSFLEDVMDNGGVPEECVKRIGGSIKISDRLKNCTLQQNSSSDAYEVRASKRVWIEALKEKLNEASNTFDILQRHTDWNEHSWQDANCYFEICKLENCDEPDSVMHDFVVPSGSAGFVMVGKKNKKLQPRDIFQAWYKGSDSHVQHVPGELWNLPLPERRLLVKGWCDEWLQWHVELFTTLMSTCETLSGNIAALDLDCKTEQLQSTRVVGATTSGACSYSQLIDRYSPTVVVIEEAAELLEAHIVATLPKSVRHLIMIGDHLQLRPKVQHYPLCKVSGHRLNLDVSLFERLALSKRFPIHTLQVQHRMRPEISAIVRQTTYPRLQDHLTVHGRDNMRGLLRNVVFVDHRELEDGCDDREGMDKLSRQNKHEAMMVVETVSYLLQQGYKHTDIVVLTPYLGQLVEIKRLLDDKKKIASSVSALDADDIQANISELTSGATDGLEEDVDKDGAVRVATIDNFQGEEANIIVASLVRSNASSNIGFLYEPERVNVLFSRARNGLIVFGNSDTLLSSNKGANLWRGIIQNLATNEFWFDGVPVVCQCHGVQQLLKCPADFAKYAPNGGCSQPCRHVISSCPDRHECWKRCHPCTPGFSGVVQCHDNIQCCHLFERKCKRGIHDMSVECWRRDKPKACTEYLDVMCKRNLHAVKQKCSLSVSSKCVHLSSVQCQYNHASFDIACHEALNSLEKKCPTCIAIETQKTKEAIAAYKKNPFFGDNDIDDGSHRGPISGMFPPHLPVASLHNAFAGVSVDIGLVATAYSIADSLIGKYGSFMSRDEMAAISVYTGEGVSYVDSFFLISIMISYALLYCS